MISEFYEDDGSPVKCIKCGSTDLKVEIIDMINMVVAEYEIICNCGEVVGYWGYGIFDPFYRNMAIELKQGQS